jgi:C-terminal processing protease CtpA/Prc
VGVAVRFGDDGCPRIRQVTDTNAADTRSKLQIGDVILTVDGKAACKMWHHEVQAGLAGPPGTVKKLHLRRGTGTVDVDVATAELLGPHP